MGQEKYKGSLRQRLGLTLPNLDRRKKGPIVWIHAVSVGEMKVASIFVEHLRKKRPDVRIVLSFVTKTGSIEARKSIQGAEAYFFLPLDFRFVIRRLVKRLTPALLCIVEGEFWYNLLDLAKKSGTQVALINGKMSERSYKRFSFVSFFAKPLFSLFDAVCLQEERYRSLFEQLGVSKERIAVTGNLKIDMHVPFLEKKDIQHRLHIDPDDFVVVCASTHRGEEKALLSAIKPLFEKIPELRVAIVPRHPERFEEVAHEIKELGLFFRRTTACSKREKTPIILVDEMGKLIEWYQIAKVAVVGGSFVPGIGGHNLFEPASCSVPVLFGPYIGGQVGAADALKASQGGISICIEEIGNTLFALYENPYLREEMGKKGANLIEQSVGSTQKTIDFLCAKSIF